MKRCIYCKKEFNLDNRHPYQEYCSNSCWKMINTKKSNHKFYEKNKKEIKDYHQEYNKRPDVITRMKAYAKEYRIKNIEKIKENFKKWLELNRDKKRAGDRIYYLENKSKWLEFSKVYHKRRYEQDISYRLIYILRRRLHSALKYYIKNGKFLSSKKYGIDYRAIIEHLKPFPEDLTKYHIDHIKPLCTFDLTNPKEIKIAFSPENHQWLLAKDNLSKGGKWNGS